MAETFTIHGLDEIQRRLNEWPERLRRRALKDVLKEGTEIMREEVERRAPKPNLTAGWEAFVGDDEHLKDNIVSKVTVTKKYASGRVGVDYSKIRHGHLVEFGHRVVIKGRDTGRMSKKIPYFRPAYDSKGDEALNRMLTKLAKAVEDNA